MFTGTCIQLFHYYHCYIKKNNHGSNKTRDRNFQQDSQGNW